MKNDINLQTECSTNRNGEEGLALIKRQNKKISELYNQLDSKDTEIEKMKINISTIQEQFQKTQQLLSQTEEKLKEAISELNSKDINEQKLLNNFTKLQNQYTNSMNQIDQYDNEVNSIKENFEDFKIRYEKAEQTLNFLTQEKCELQNKLIVSIENEKRLKNTIQEITLNIHQKDAKIKELTEVNKSILKRENETKGTLEAFEKKITKIKAKLKSKKVEKEDLINECQKINSIYNKTKEELSALQSNYQNMIKEKNIELISQLQESERMKNALITDLNNFFDIFSGEITNCVSQTEENIIKNVSNHIAMYTSMKNLKEGFQDVSELIPSLSDMYLCYDKLSNFCTSTSVKFKNLNLKLKKLEKQINFHEQISKESTKKLEEINKMNEQQTTYFKNVQKEFSESMSTLQEKNAKLEDDMKCFKNILYHSYQEIYKSYDNINKKSNIFLNLKERPKIEDNEDIKDILFFFENVSRDLIDYVVVLNKSSFKTTSLQEENDRLKKELSSIHQQLLENKILLNKAKEERNGLNPVYQGKNLKNELGNEKQKFETEIKNLKNIIQEKSDENQKIRNDYQLLYSQYKLMTTNTNRRIISYN